MKLSIEKFFMMRARVMGSGMIPLIYVVAAGTLHAQDVHVAKRTTENGVVAREPQPSLVVVAPVLTMEATAADTGVITGKITAAQAAADLGVRIRSMVMRLPLKRAYYPMDSLHAAVTAAASPWLARLRAHPIRGIQLDPAGRVSVAAGQEGYAKQQLAARLSTPRLSFADRAYTLRIAVQAFGDRWAPERLPTAEAYLKDLDALGDSAAGWQFDARSHLMSVYYAMGRSADVARLGVRAIALMGQTPYYERRPEFLSGDVYHMTVDALTSRSDGRVQIARLDTLYRAATIPPPGLIAFDSAYAPMADTYRWASNNVIAGNAKLGTHGAPLVAHAWVNRASKDSATIAVDDGKIRVVEMAHTGCKPCIDAVYALQELHEQFPAIEPIMLTWTFGYWGGRLVEPAEEIQHLTDYFVTNTHVTYPVGIWAGRKIPNEDGGMTPEESLNTKNYPLFGKPMLWIIDGHGIIRKVFTGYSKDIHEELVRTIEFLQHEAQG